MRRRKDDAHERFLFVGFDSVPCPCLPASGCDGSVPDAELDVTLHIKQATGPSRGRCIIIPPALLCADDSIVFDGTRDGRPTIENVPLSSIIMDDLSALFRAPRVK